jgi:hypothetical protein
MPRAEIPALAGHFERNHPAFCLLDMNCSALFVGCKQIFPAKLPDLDGARADD